MTVISPQQIRDERIRREREFYLADENLLDFVRDFGAAPDATEFPHGSGLRFLSRWSFSTDSERRRLYKGKLILWPRGSFKSQVFSIGYIAREIARDPNVRAFISSETGRQARKFIANVMAILDTPKYQELFGIHHGADWNRFGFTSALRTSTHLKEPTLAGFGVGEVQTGAHWDIGAFDDVVSQENTKTPLSVEATRDWFGEMMAQLDPGSRFFMVGTHHHHADIYATIKKDQKLRDLFEITSHSWRNDDGTLFFPERITQEFVERQKLIMTPRLFSCFYENKPVGTDQQIFLPTYFRTVRDSDVPRSVWTFILTDFAFTSKAENDRTAFWVVALDTHRIAYVREVIVGRWKPSDSVRILCDTWNRYIDQDIKAVTIELGAHDELIKGLLEEIRRQTFIRPRIVTLAGRSQEVKNMRIEGIEPRFRRGDIYFCESFRQKSPQSFNIMMTEMTEWPFSEHDDIPDAISDLDKKDAHNKYVCPGPPQGWTPYQLKRYDPALVDGKYNKAVPVDAREMIKRLGNRQGQDIWSQNESPGRANQADLFKRRGNVPWQPKPS